jgi:polar amino acid transport system substrate-binding protein
MKKYLFLFLYWSALCAYTLSPAAQPTLYQVKEGDTLSQISAQFQLKLSDLIAWNGLNIPYHLKIGQQLHLTPPSLTHDNSALHTQLNAFTESPEHTDTLQRQIFNLTSKIKELEHKIENISPLHSPTLADTSDTSEYDYYPPDIREIKERGTLIVMQYDGIREGFFMYDDDNSFAELDSYHDGKARLIGYDIELAHKLAAYLGVKLELRRTAKNFTEACKIVGRGEADLALSKLTITLDRAQYVSFSMPYVELRLGMLINRLEEAKLTEGKSSADHDLSTLFNQPDAHIAVETGTAWIAFARTLFPRAKLIEYPDLTTTIDAVERGEALAMLNDEWNIASALRISPEIAVRVRLAFVPNIKTGLAAAVNPTKPHLLSFINAMIERDHLQTSAIELLDKYFAQGTADRVSSSMALLAESAGETTSSPASILLIIVLILVFLLAWGLMAYQRPHDKDTKSHLHSDDASNNP